MRKFNNDRDLVSFIEYLKTIKNDEEFNKTIEEFNKYYKDDEYREYSSLSEIEE